VVVVAFAVVSIHAFYKGHVKLEGRAECTLRIGKERRWGIVVFEASKVLD